VRRTLTTIIFMTFSLPVFSATWTNGTQDIQHIMWAPPGYGFYVTGSTYHDPESCGPGKLYLVNPALSDKEIDRLYSMLLTAFTTGKKIHVWVDGCKQGKPKFSGLQINK